MFPVRRPRGPPRGPSRVTYRLTIRVSVRLARDQAALARTFTDLSWSDIRMAFAVSATKMTSYKISKTKHHVTSGARPTTFEIHNFTFKYGLEASTTNSNLEMKIHLLSQYTILLMLQFGPWVISQGSSPTILWCTWLPEKPMDLASEPLDTWPVALIHGSWASIPLTTHVSETTSSWGDSACFPGPPQRSSALTHRGLG